MTGRAAQRNSPAPSGERKLRIDGELGIKGAGKGEPLRTRAGRTSSGKQRIHGLLAVLLVVATASTVTANADDPPPPPTTGTLSGAVTESGAGTLAGVTVTASGPETREATTGADGTYAFADVAPGDYSVSASACGFTGATSTATVTAGETTTQDFSLSREVVSVIGAVTATGGAPLAARIDVSAPYTGAPANTDPGTGAYSLSLESCREYTFTVTVTSDAYDYDPLTRIVNPPSGGSVEDFVLPPTTGGVAGTVTQAADGTPLAGATVTVTDGIRTFTATSASNGAYRVRSVPPGTYEVRIDACGFTSQTVTGAEVTVGNDTGAGFALERLLAAVTGTVTDASGAGWPLYAQIDVTGAQTLTTFTDPVTGAYSLAINPCRTFTFAVRAVSGGYQVATRTVVPPATPSAQNFALVVTQTPCTAPGYHLVTKLSEGFNGGALPSGWSNTDDLPGGGRRWRFDNPGNRQYGVNAEFFMHEPFAIYDADYNFQNSDASADTSLITKAVDTSRLRRVVLEFDSDNYAYNSWAYVDLSVDNGASWTRVAEIPAEQLNQQGNRNVLVHYSLDISALAAGKTSVKARFRYFGLYYSKWWALDAIRIGTPGCVVAADGLAVGQVLRAGDGSPVLGASVTDEYGVAATTFATPADPAQGDGFYIIGAQAGLRKLVARAPAYGSDQRTVTIAPAGAIRREFVLPPRYSALPAWATETFTTSASRDQSGFDFVDPSWNYARGSRLDGTFDVSANVEEFFPTFFSGTKIGLVSSTSTAKFTHTVDITGNFPHVAAVFSLSSGAAAAKTYKELQQLAQTAGASVTVTGRFTYQRCTGGTCTATGAPGSSITVIKNGCTPSSCVMGPLEVAGDVVGTDGPGRVIVEITITATASASGHADASARLAGTFAQVLIS